MKINNHLVSISEWQEWENYSEYIFEDEITIEDYDAWKDTPSKASCDEMCEKQSGNVKVYYL